MLAILQILIPNATTTVLNTLIDYCKVLATDYCNLDEYSTDLDEVVILMVQERYNKLDGDGIASRSYSGISESYTSDFSPMVYKALRKHRKLRSINASSENENSN